MKNLFRTISWNLYRADSLENAVDVVTCIVNSTLMFIILPLLLSYDLICHKPHIYNDYEIKERT